MKNFTLKNEAGETRAYTLLDNTIVSPDGIEQFETEADACYALVMRSSTLISEGWSLDVMGAFH